MRSQNANLDIASEEIWAAQVGRSGGNGTRDGTTYSVDLLLYCIDLRCFVVVELKAVPVEPEFAGKLNFYLSAVDDRFRREGDAPSIGLLLCPAITTVNVTPGASSAMSVSTSRRVPGSSSLRTPSRVERHDDEWRH